ncbi:hypothetical protein [Clavibacter sp. VKM Ac-2872]|uniref:hypothetical protein n=1 Tax=Clavibacter sp. VKM Ac-2872 TaxID=2783812 RepID=UPI00188A3EDA|nr:hypothetical protein [Clavibacter sp. VKM Ac-2872]MBF4624020.1 hypothetical protein [Clavibacter sp. VKM Ac-2872]
MTQQEHEIVQIAIEKWISAGLEYAHGAGGVRALYVYIGSELGSAYANVFFEQDGEVLYPSKLKGADASTEKIIELQRYLVDVLDEAEAAFKKSQIPPPTEYRITYEPGSGRLDVQLSREVKYRHHPVKTIQHGPEDWLNGRLEKLYGALLPPEDQWPKS